LERPGPLLQPFPVGPFYFPPHLLTKGENKTTLLKFTERILHYRVNLSLSNRSASALPKRRVEPNRIRNIIHVLSQEILPVNPVNCIACVSSFDYRLYWWAVPTLHGCVNRYGFGLRVCRFAGDVENAPAVPLNNPIAIGSQWHKRRLSVCGHGQTSLTVAPVVVNLNFLNSPAVLRFH